jgi:uncharacterized protein
LHTYTETIAASYISFRPFFKLSAYAVVGASTDRKKFGNKVLRCYLQHGYAVTPINKNVNEIEGLQCHSTLTQWYNDLNMSNTKDNKDNNNNVTAGVSIITPPGVTKMILEEGLALGIKHYYLQPGTYDDVTLEFIEAQKVVYEFDIVKSCLLVELGFDDV